MVAKVLLISTPEIRILAWRGVAQLGSAGALGALGRRFESCRPDWFFGDLELGMGPRWALLNLKTSALKLFELPNQVNSSSCK